MTARSTPLSPRTAGPRLAALRGDLVAAPAERSGRRVVVLKDPAGHRFFELSEEDHALAKTLTPGRGLKSQLAASRAEAPTACAGLDDVALARRLARLSSELRRNGLAEGLAGGGPRAVAPGWAGTTRRWLGKVAGVLFVRVRLGDPTRWLDATQGWFAPWFTRGFWIGAAVFGLVSAAVFFGAGGAGAFDPRWFAGWPALLALYVGVAGLKFVHEAAHAVTVRRHGGAVHEVGVLLAAGMPLFYVEASDSYLFPRRSQRVAVAAAGILVELVVAAALVWPWWLLADGFARQWLHNLILVASVGTLVFNGNPLMRYDGYYALADAIDMPSLRERSRAWLAARVEGWLLGVREATPGGAAARRERRILGCYGVASLVYLVAVMFGIWRFLSATLEPHGLKWLGDSVMASWALGSLAWPLAGYVRRVATRARALGSARVRGRLVRFGALGIVAVIVAAVPWPRRVGHVCELRPAEAMRVRAEEAGVVREVFVREGEGVRAGDVLARLENPEVAAAGDAARAEREQAEARLRLALVGGAADAVGQARANRAAAEARLAAAKARLAALTLRAPGEGVAASPRPELWLGRRLAAGEVFGVVRPAAPDEVVVPLSEKDARRVVAGAVARLRVHAFPDRILRGVVAGSPLRVEAGPGVRPPGEETHFVVVRLLEPDPDLRPGMTGRARIDCGRASLAKQGWEAAVDFLRLDYRMR